MAFAPQFIVSPFYEEKKEGPEIEKFFLVSSKLRNMMIEEQMMPNSTSICLHKHTWGASLKSIGNN
jgi:hypothetical protein